MKKSAKSESQDRNDIEQIKNSILSLVGDDASTRINLDILDDALTAGGKAYERTGRDIVSKLTNHIEERFSLPSKDFSVSFDIKKKSISVVPVEQNSVGDSMAKIFKELKEANKGNKIMEASLKNNTVTFRSKTQSLGDLVDGINKVMGGHEKIKHPSQFMDPVL